MDWLIVATMLAATLPFFAIIVAVNLRLGGRITAPPVQDSAGWVIGLWWLAGAVVVFVLFILLGVVFDWPNQGRAFDFIMATMVGSMLAAPIVPYHLWITRRLWRRSARR